MNSDYDDNIWLIFFDVLSRLVKIEETNSGKKLTAGELTGLIRKKIGNELVKVSTEKSPDVMIDDVIVAAYFDPDADTDEQSIEVVLVYNPDQKYYFIEKLEWQSVCFMIAEALCHEFVHLGQHLKNEDVYVISAPGGNDVTYIGTDSEIEAFGFSIAAEAVLFDIPYTETEMYEVYDNAFEPDSKVMLKLKYQIMKFMNLAEKL